MIFLILSSTIGSGPVILKIDIEGYECKVNMNTFIHNSKYKHSLKLMKLPDVGRMQPITKFLQLPMSTCYKKFYVSIGIHSYRVRQNMEWASSFWTI